MERALAHQVADRLDSAAQDYAAVLARAPSTHDALHMAGVIELARRNFDEAERLIVAAMALRPAYQAIEHNLQLVADARLAALRAQPEELCERALPIFVELALRGRATTAAHHHRSPRSSAAESGLHLVGRMHARDDDDSWLLRRLAKLLHARAPCVWATDAPAFLPPSAPGRRSIVADAGEFPRGGTHVFVGVNFDTAPWIARADAERVIVLCFGAAPSGYLDALRAIARDGARAVELVFPAQALAARFGPGHAVIPPPFEADLRCDREDAVPEPSHCQRTPQDPRPWSAGIVGQNRRFVTEAVDVDFLRAIAKQAGRLHVYDPGRLRYALGGDARVRSFIRRDAGLPEFIRTVSCLIHRPATWWEESLERGFFAAMAGGKPVLCPRTSIYAEYIEHEADGLLYDSADEALRQIADLQRAPAMADALGAAARAKAAHLFEPQALARRYAQLIAGNAEIAVSPRNVYESRIEILR